MSTPERPRPRIGDSERDLAVGYLQEHMAAGRLDQEEFDERMSQALAARTEDDLLPLFLDLPEPRISGTGPGVSALARRPADDGLRRRPSRSVVNAGRGLAAASWPLAIIGASVLGWGSFWWFVFIPIFVTPWLLGLFGLTEEGEPEDEEEDEDDDRDRGTARG